MKRGYYWMRRGKQFDLKFELCMIYAEATQESLVGLD